MLLVFEEAGTGREVSGRRRVREGERELERIEGLAGGREGER